MKKFFVIFFSFLFAVQSFAQDQVNQQMSEQQQHLFSLFFNEALKSRLKGDYQKSIQMYINCLKLDESSSVVPFEIAKILSLESDIENANKFIDMALKNDDTNNKYFLDLAVSIKVSLRKYSEALSLIDKLIVLDPQDINTYIFASNICLEQKDYDAALSYINKIPYDPQYDNVILQNKYNIYINKIEPRKAYKLINSKLKKRPDNALYNFLMADYYLRVKDSKGLQYLEKSVKCPEGEIYNFDLASVYLQLGKKDEFISSSLNGFSCPSIPFQVKFNKLINSLSNKNSFINSEDGQKFYTQVFDTLVSQYPDEEQLFSLYSEYSTSLNNIDKSISLYEQLLLSHDISPESWHDFLLKLSSKGDNDKLFDYTSKAIVNNPDDPLILLLYGECFIQKNNYLDAIKPLRQSYSVLLQNSNPQTNNLKVAVMNDLASAYFYVDSTKEAYYFFEEVLKVDNYNLTALNNYSYYLSISGGDLDKAEQMSRKTIEIDPLNSTYLDTYAWILFKKKNYSESLFIMERAIDNLKRDEGLMEIYDHYGDILYMTGQVDKAVEYWNKAFDESQSDIIKQKIDAKKIIE